jgi:hypothetical protein
MNKLHIIIEEHNLVQALRSTVTPIKLFSADSLAAALDPASKWVYEARQVDPAEALQLIRNSVAVAFSTRKDGTHVTKLCLCGKRSAEERPVWPSPPNLADRLAALPMWPKPAGPYDGTNRVLDPQGFLRYPCRAGDSYQPYLSFLRNNCGLGTA